MALVLLTVMLMMAALDYPYLPANARSLTHAIHITADHTTNCDGVQCHTLVCINKKCHGSASNTTEALNSTIP